MSMHILNYNLCKNRIILFVLHCDIKVDLDTLNSPQRHSRADHRAPVHDTVLAVGSLLLALEGKALGGTAPGGKVLGGIVLGSTDPLTSHLVYQTRQMGVGSGSPVIKFASFNI
jgi:hypothetical protein